MAIFCNFLVNKQYVHAFYPNKKKIVKFDMDGIIVIVLLLSVFVVEEKLQTLVT